MYGDVFNNRLGEAAAATDDGTESQISWTAIVPNTPMYGYDPWTKTSFRLDKGVRWWTFKPRSVVWHASLQYTLGSVLFVAASYCALFVSVRARPDYNKWLFAYPYAVGSVMYTIGATLLLGVSWRNHPAWAHPLQTPRRPALQSPRGGAGGSAVFNFSRPPSVTSTQVLLAEDPTAPSLEASHVFTESRPPSMVPSVRDSDWGVLARETTLPSEQPTPITSVVIADGRAHLLPDNNALPALPPRPTSPLSNRFRAAERAQQAGQPPSSGAESPAQRDTSPAPAHRNAPSDNIDSRLRQEVAGAHGPALSPLQSPTASQQHSVRWKDVIGHGRSRSQARSVSSSRPRSRSRSRSRSGQQGANASGNADDGGGSDSESVATTASVYTASRGAGGESEGDAGRPNLFVRRFMNRWRTTSTAENVTQALLAQHPRRSVHLDRVLAQHYTRDANYYIHTDPWYTTRWLLDVLGSLAIWIGALLYNVSCFAGAWQAYTGYYPWCRERSSEVCERWLDFWPDVVGGVLFVLGSWLFHWAAHETPLPTTRKFRSVEWFLTLFNIVGSVGFFYGAASTRTVVDVPGMVHNWVELLIGYVFGSAFFLFGSYLMIVQIATNAE